MPDNFASHATGLTSPASIHRTITPNNGIDLPFRPRALKALTAGNVAVRDAAGTIITYPVVAGEVLDFRATGVESTGTTATVVGWE
jgi:hypothetical protein